MMMRYILVTFFSFLGLAGHAQDDGGRRFDIGDAAPALRVRQWLKGEPVREFKKGQLYVVEFWATWCRPCIAGMPHFSELAREYRGRIDFLSIDVYEPKKTPRSKIQRFVDSMGTHMDYSVAEEDSNDMETGWLAAFNTKDEGIPRAFVIDGRGRVAWIGHPHVIDTVLRQLVNGTWDIGAALAARQRKKYLDSLDMEVSFQLAPFRPDVMKPGDTGRPDLALAMIDSMTKREPGLKYFGSTAGTTFYSLLKTDPAKADVYGKELLAVSTYDDPKEGIVFGAVEDYSGKAKLPADLYRLAIRAYRVYMDRYPETVDLPRGYDEIAAWYWRVDDKPDAIAAEEKAVDVLRSGKARSRMKMTVLEGRLQEYKKGI